MSWVIRNTKADVKGLCEATRLSPVTIRILANRGYTTKEAITKFLRPSAEELHDPMLLDDMGKAIALLKEAVEKKEKIRIIGDYDVDGICSTYILLLCLRKAGAVVDYDIPERIADGYGLNTRIIEQAHKDGIQMIVTCDNGIAANEAVSLAKGYGIKVIVTDHHEVPYAEEYGNRFEILPEADAVVDPKREKDSYPYKGICGAVVAWKVMQAFGTDEKLLDNLLGIVAIATVCDVMDLVDENRYIVKRGMEKIHTQPNLGIYRLALANNIDIKKVSVYHMGFILGPCLNASGRLESAKKGIALLEAIDEDEAAQIALSLKELNDERKRLTADGVSQGISYVEKHGLDKVLVVYLPDTHESVAGIIAGKLREKYHHPTFVLTKTKDGFVKGSGRSIPAYNMYDELVACKDNLLKFGGHKMAAGVTMIESQIDQFRKSLNERCSLSESDFDEKVVIDVAIPAREISISLMHELELLEPYGNGNPKPVFAEKDLLFTYAKIIGKNNNAVRFTVKAGERRSDAIMFGDATDIRKVFTEAYGYRGEKIFEKATIGVPMNCIYEPEINDFNGIESVQMTIRKLAKGNDV